jgi:membrane-associated phospholipid phosphatase
MWSNALARIDDVIFAWITLLDARSTAFHNVIAYLPSEQASGVLFMSIFWWYWFRRTDPETTQRTREHLLCTMFGAAIGLFAARVMALTLPFRLRPRFEPALHLIWPDKLESFILMDWSAFPSDHAVMFCALAVGLGFVSWRVGLAALLYTFLIVAFPRVYFGIHYPTDILAGAALGALAACSANSASGRRQLASPMLRWEQRSPQSFYVGLFITSVQFATLFSGVRQGARAVFRMLAAVVSAHFGH